MVELRPDGIKECATVKTRDGFEERKIQPPIQSNVPGRWSNDEKSFKRVWNCSSVAASNSYVHRAGLDLAPQPLQADVQIGYRGISRRPMATITIAFRVLPPNEMRHT